MWNIEDQPWVRCHLEYLRSMRVTGITLYLSRSQSISHLFSYNLGDVQAAIQEHETEMLACETSKDVCGQAVAARKLGECYLEISEFDKAEEVGY